MNILVRHIEYLVSRHDCVIIPGIGAILANYKSASYDSATRVFTAPRREFSFNPQLTDNDGLLAWSVSRGEGISIDAALRTVLAEADTMKHQLMAHGALPLGKVGVLGYDSADGTFSFEPFSTDRLSAATMWLGDVHAVRLADAEDSSAQAETQDVTHSPSAFSRVFRIAASIAVLICVWFMASTPIVIDDALMASLLPEISTASIEEIVPQKPESDAVEVSPTEVIEPEETEVEIADSGSDSASASPAESGEVAEAATLTVTDEYIVVVASLATEAEAEKFLQMHPEPELRVVQSGRYFRIYTSAHSSQKEAAQSCRNLREKYPDAWVTKL